MIKLITMKWLIKYFFKYLLILKDIKKKRNRMLEPKNFYNSNLCHYYSLNNS